MKRSLKVVLVILGCLIVIFCGFLIFFHLITMGENLDTDKLVNMDKTVSFYDIKGDFLFKDSDCRSISDIEIIPKHVQNAFVSIEDKRFYSHNGIDPKGLLRATVENIKSMSFKEGGSTITQQLVKNTHFSNKKTLKRKLSEIKLALQMEKTYSKSEIMEKYLNTIYFGDNCYGITSASRHYFDKNPEELSISEGAVLAGMIKAPAIYSPFNDKEKCLKRRNIVLKQMLSQGYLSKSEYSLEIKKDIKTLESEQNRSDYDYFYLARKEYQELMKNFPYETGKIKVYTGFSFEKQKILEDKIFNDNLIYNKTCVLMNKNGVISAYKSTCGNVKRQMGSTAKPFLVYAPAIENNVVYSCSPILDEKTDFNGYSPSNYGEIYHGYVSVKESLAQSLNVCAVKLLNYTGINKAKNYAIKSGITLTSNDNSLALALGATEKGEYLQDICSAYTPFMNNGYCFNAKTITKITNDKNQILYQNKQSFNKVFSEETTSLVNDALEYTVTNGTAKKLSFSKVNLCAKTGTVGNQNGNTDAYCISYNTDQLLGVWYGNVNGKYMNNSVTGGSYPTTTAYNIWNELYLDSEPPKSYNKSNKIIELEIDKEEYEENHRVILADKLAPSRYKIKTIFKKNYFPKSTSNNYSMPKIENVNLSVFSNGIKLSLCLTENTEATIYKCYKGKKIKVFDTIEKNNKLYFFDRNVKQEEEFYYSIIPYSLNGNIKKIGKEYRTEKIKFNKISNDFWAK